VEPKELTKLKLLLRRELSARKKREIEKKGVVVFTWVVLGG
jgi:hypothetical protein